MVVDKPFYIVAVIGWRHALPVRARGILERSGISPVSFADAFEARRSLTTRLRVDAILLDGKFMGQEEDDHEEADMADLLALAAAPPWQDGPIPVILLTSNDTPCYLRKLGRSGHVHAMSRSRFGYRRISGLITRLCAGGNGQSDSPRTVGPLAHP
jgi:hypothetical protein